MVVSNAQDDVFDSLLRQLKDRASAKRRSAAKKLRKLGGGKACGALLEALQDELPGSAYLGGQVPNELTRCVA